jgi:hypothetical protein
MLIGQIGELIRRGGGTQKIVSDALPIFPGEVPD